MLEVLWGGGGRAVLPGWFVSFPKEPALAHAPDRSVAATLQRRGSGARGFTSRSCACSSPPRRIAVLVRPGLRSKAFPRVGLSRFPGYGGLAAHAQRRWVPVGGRYLPRSVVSCQRPLVCYAAPPPPLVQEATHEPVQRVSSGCCPGAARPCRQASALSHASRSWGVCAGGGSEPSPPSTTLLPPWCGGLWAGCCPKRHSLPPLAPRVGPVTHSITFTSTPC